MKCSSSEMLSKDLTYELYLRQISLLHLALPSFVTTSKKTTLKDLDHTLTMFQNMQNVY